MAPHCILRDMRAGVSRRSPDSLACGRASFWEALVPPQRASCAKRSLRGTHSGSLPSKPSLEFRNLRAGLSPCQWRHSPIIWAMVFSYSATIFLQEKWKQAGTGTTQWFLLSRRCPCTRHQQPVQEDKSHGSQWLRGWGSPPTSALSLQTQVGSCSLCTTLNTSLPCIIQNTLCLSTAHWEKNKAKTSVW